MRFDAVTVTVTTAGTRVALTTAGINATDKVLWARFKGRPNNTGTTYVGIDDVSATNGFSLENSDDVGLTLDLRGLGGRILASEVYCDAATNGDRVECALILE